MTRRSGWCSDWNGVCSSKGLHAVCQQRIDDGMLDGCGCDLHEPEKED